MKGKKKKWKRGQVLYSDEEGKRNAKRGKMGKN